MLGLSARTRGRGACAPAWTVKSTLETGLPSPPEDGRTFPTRTDLSRSRQSGSHPSLSASLQPG